MPDLRDATFHYRDGVVAVGTARLTPEEQKKTKVLAEMLVDILNAAHVTPTIGLAAVCKTYVDCILSLLDSFPETRHALVASTEFMMGEVIDIVNRHEIGSDRA